MNRRHPWRALIFGLFLTLGATVAVGFYLKRAAVEEWQRTLTEADAKGVFESPPDGIPEGVVTFDAWLRELASTRERLGGFDGPKGLSPEFEAMRAALDQCHPIMRQPSAQTVEELIAVNNDWNVRAPMDFAKRLMEADLVLQDQRSFRQCLRVAEGLLTGRLADLRIASDLLVDTVDRFGSASPSLDGETRALIRELDPLGALGPALRREPMMKRPVLVSFVEGDHFAPRIDPWFGQRERAFTRLLRGYVASLEVLEAPRGSDPTGTRNRLLEADGVRGDRLRLRLPGFRLEVLDTYDQLMEAERRLAPLR